MKGCTYELAMPANLKNFQHSSLKLPMTQILSYFCLLLCSTVYETTYNNFSGCLSIVEIKQSPKRTGIEVMQLRHNMYIRAVRLRDFGTFFMSQAYHYIIRLITMLISSRSRVRGRLDHCLCTQFVLGGFN